MDSDLTDRFRALAGHYLFEPRFTRPGEGHNKGGVEARGKGICLGHLTPIPRGRSLQEIAATLLTEVERVDYSVPSHWARLEATACVGVEDIRITCFGEEVTIVRERRGTRQVNPVRCVLSNGVKYAHCLRKLARKPQAVRQMAPDILGELSEVYGELWKVPAETHGEHDAARVLSKILAAVLDHAGETIRHTIEQALAAGRQELPAPALELHRMPKRSEAQVPVALQGYSIEAGCAADYDVLLVGDGA